jgi:hypothetical protein
MSSGAKRRNDRKARSETKIQRANRMAARLSDRRQCGCEGAVSATKSKHGQ